MKLDFFSKKTFVKGLAVIAALCVSWQVFAATGHTKATKKTFATPAGYWNTIDHDTNKPSSVIKIWQAKDGLYYGKIDYIYPEHGHKKSDVCKKCKGPLHNKPILGMQIIQHFQATQDPNFYNKGRIMDPTNGKTYKCRMTLKEKGSVLDVHGYIGIPLFGRSDIWYRTQKPVKQ